jgi:hypothetical protein
VQQLQQQVQQLQQQLQMDAQKSAAQVNIAQIRAASAEKIATIKAQTQKDIALGNQAAKHYVAELQSQLKQKDAQIMQEKNVIAQGNLLLEREALSNAIMQADREFQLQLQAAGAPQLPTETQDLGNDAPFISELRGKNGVGGEAGTISRGRFGMIPGMAG